MILIIIIINKVEMFEKSQAKAEFFASIMGRGIMMVALSLIKYRSSMMIVIIMIVMIIMIMMVSLSLITYLHNSDHDDDEYNAGFDESPDLDEYCHSQRALFNRGFQCHCTLTNMIMMIMKTMIIIKTMMMMIMMITVIMMTHVTAGTS